jgi:hypothetical protein
MGHGQRRARRPDLRSEINIHPAAGSGEPDDGPPAARVFTAIGGGSARRPPSKCDQARIRR